MSFGEIVAVTALGVVVLDMCIEIARKVAANRQ
jgi:hypothetical protein